MTHRATSAVTRDPEVFATGELLAVLARDLSLVVADYIASIQGPVFVSAGTGAFEDPASTDGAPIADQLGSNVDHRLQDTLETAELVVAAHQIHILAMGRAGRFPQPPTG
jgi:hypothetical protein